MVTGHFALAAAVKAKRPEVPLWSLMVASQALDILFVPLLLLGVEGIEGAGYGNATVHAAYSHSLVGTLLLAVLGGLLAGRSWGRRAGVTIGAVIFSHWLLDLLVHRPDMPIFPGNLGDFPLLGLGLWRWPGASAAVEGVLAVLGAVLYARSVMSQVGEGSLTKGRAVVGSAVMAAVLALLFAADALGIGA
jgi:hypothetical protein